MGLDPISAGSLIKGGASILGSLFGASGSASASKAQLQGVRETNAQNYRIWQEQKQYNKDMYDYQFDKEAAYNDPSAVRKRLEEAGYNPYLMYGDSAGAPSPGMNQVTPPTMMAATSSAYVTPFKAIGDSIMQGAQIFDVLSNASRSNAEAGSIRDKLPLEMKQLYWLNSTSEERLKQLKEMFPWNKEKISEETRGLRLSNDFNLYTMAQREEAIKLQNDNIRAINANALLTGEGLRIANQYLPTEKQLGILQTVQMLYNLQKAGVLTEAQIKKTVAERIQVEAATEGQEIDNYKSRAVADSFIRATNASYQYDYILNSHNYDSESNLRPSSYRQAYNYDRFKSRNDYRLEDRRLFQEDRRISQYDRYLDYYKYDTRTRRADMIWRNTNGTIGSVSSFFPRLGSRGSSRSHTDSRGPQFGSDHYYPERYY